MLEIKEIWKTFNAGTVNEKQALRGVSLTLNDGDFCTVIGGNGAGKSTMLNAVAGTWAVDAGTISIGDIRRYGRELNSIEPMVRQTARTVRVGDDAKESFDYLLDSGANYVVVLNEDDTIAGIVTKTSVARSVAENLWGAGS